MRRASKGKRTTPSKRAFILTHMWRSWNAFKYIKSVIKGRNMNLVRKHENCRIRLRRLVNENIYRESSKIEWEKAWWRNSQSHQPNIQVTNKVPHRKTHSIQKIPIMFPLFPLNATTHTHPPFALYSSLSNNLEHVIS